jgi:MerR family transcriptional regulator, copper efflux regulator
LATSPHASNGSHLLRVGDLARLTGKSVRAIRLYEEIGLLQPATRSSGGFRLYDASAVERIRWIELLHGLGFSLQEMRELRDSWWRSGFGHDAMEALRGLFERKLEDTRVAIQRHQQLERELRDGLAYLETCRACATPSVAVGGCARCEQDHGMTEEPALVAGIVTAPEPARRTGRRALVRIEDIG